jgi:ureidoglycolate lyase
VRAIRPEALTAAAFAAFGDVIETRGEFELVNRDTSRRFADLAKVDVTDSRGRPQVSIYRAEPFALPLAITMLERHPLSSQLFMPLDGKPFLIVVAPAGDDVAASAVRAFVTNGRQGINYRRGTWHHPLIALGSVCEFLVVDRVGEGKDCDEVSFNVDALVVQPPEPQASR